MARRRRGKGGTRRRPPRSAGGPSRRRTRRRTVVIGSVAAASLVASLIVGRLTIDGSRGHARVHPEAADPVVMGEILYARHCASCHGVELEGQPNWKSRLPDGRLPAPPHDATGHTWHHDDDYLFDTTKNGGQATAPRGFLSGMPAFAGELSDTEIRAILAFIKSRWPPEIRARQGNAHRW